MARHSRTGNAISDHLVDGEIAIAMFEFRSCQRWRTWTTRPINAMASCAPFAKDLCTRLAFAFADIFAILKTSLQAGSFSAMESASEERHRPQFGPGELGDPTLRFLQV